MKHSLNIGKEPSLQKIVIASAVLHLLFITLVAIPIKGRERDFRTYYVKLVEPIQTATTKSAPLTKSAETAKETVPSKKVIKAPPKTDMSLEEVERAEKEIERIRAISALSKQKKENEKVEKEIERIRAISALSKQKKEIHIGGGKTTGKPSQATGPAGNESGEDTDFYYALIKQKIEQYWVIPDFKTPSLPVIISIKMDKDGKVISQEIEKSSGDVLFDRAAIKAISKASPLPPPPKEMEIGLVFQP